MIVRADARALPLADGCVQCVVTSPPYFGLRDYGDVLQIGLEPTPRAYVDSLRAVFVELWRVLASDGTCWLNLGDSYVSVGSAVQGSNGQMADRAVVKSRAQVRDNKAVHNSILRPPSVGGLQPKNLVGIPWRVAFALQADGWYLRSDIIWSKPNPMPESVTDRPTKAHEYLFLLTKAERYYYDADAIAESVSASMLMEVAQGYNGLGLKDYESAGVQNPSTVKARIIANARSRALNKSAAIPGQQPSGRSQMTTGHIWEGPTRNKRTVWTIPTMPYAGAHFATMPEALVEPCILAGCPLGGLVLDPFLGSGTVGAVASRLGRRWVGTDLSYQPLSKARTRQRGLMFDVGDSERSELGRTTNAVDPVDGIITG